MDERIRKILQRLRGQQIEAAKVVEVFREELKRDGLSEKELPVSRVLGAAILSGILKKDRSSDTFRVT